MSPHVYFTESEIQNEIADIVNGGPLRYGTPFFDRAMDYYRYFLTRAKSPSDIESQIIGFMMRDFKELIRNEFRRPEDIA